MTGGPSESYGGPKTGENLNDWLGRLSEERKVVLLTRSEAGNLRTLTAAQKHAEENNLLLVRVGNLRSEVEGPTISLTREQAKDPATYRAAKRQAEKEGMSVVIEPHEEW